MRDILHCDMNNFYASVEIMLNPSLKDKCVAVGGSVENRHGIILAKNYAAKAYGVSTGEAIWEAKQKCRDLVVVPPNYDNYLKYSELAKEIYLRYTDMVEPYGMDECWLDITGSGIFGTAEEIAEKIRQSIKNELGLTVSIGVSFNKIFAKLGSDMKKPDAITVIKKETFKEQIWGLPVNELLGVGRATNKVLQNYGVKTIGSLANLHDSVLKSSFGINGLKLKAFANGLDNSEVKRNDYVSDIKSVGHGITTTKDLKNAEEVWCVILALSQKIGTRLKNHRKKAKGIAVTIKNNELKSKEWQCRVEVATQSAIQISGTAYKLFKERYSWEKEIRAVTVRAIDLIDEDTPVQLSLFCDFNTAMKKENLDLAVEDIRKRFGKESVKNAVLFKNINLPKLDNKVIMPTGMV